ncbi:family 20 glycosylhydrolase [Roseateles sp.]|uniref:family 20 glycosylhydrolase n=1 Tax=Roseateles sp. TaxID=1971397 RepID=UPI003BA7EB39
MSPVTSFPLNAAEPSCTWLQDRLLFPPASMTALPGLGPSVQGLQGLEDLPEPWRGLALSLLPAAAGSQAGLARLQLSGAWLSSSVAAPPPLGEDESFQLELSEQRVHLQAPASVGLSHGLHALSQCLHAARQAGLTHLPAMLLSDAPRYPWRGLMVDVVRRPLPFDALLGLLDSMAAARLNVLHWHLTDDQGWRLESERFPRLHQIGGGGVCYTLRQAETLVREATARGIRVVPEVDLPGHCWALALAYPELVCEPRPQGAQSGFGVFPCAVNPLKEGLYSFLDGLVGEWAQVFPDRYLHLGGDELAPQAWLALAQAQGCTVAHLQAHYLAELGAVLRRHDRRLVAWDEMGEPIDGEDASLPEGSVLQAWRGEGALRFQPAAAVGRLRSAGYYLDQIHPVAWRWRARPQPSDQVAAPAEGSAYVLSARLGTWDLQGKLWLDEAGGAPRLWLRSSGSLSEGLAPQLVPDTLHQWRLRVDSDLGELELWGPALGAAAEPSQPAEGWLRQGNVRVPCQWQALADCAPDEWPAATPALPGGQPSGVLGGEAALWSELIEAPQLPLRTGTALLAVAERLWSDPDVEGRHAQTLALRLAGGWQWMQDCGRVPTDPQGLLLNRLAPQGVEPLRAAALWLEPGAGYARQHAKKARGRYTQQEPLNQLADALPAESPLMLDLGDNAEAWQQALHALLLALPTWGQLPLGAAWLARLEALAQLGLMLWRSEAPLSLAEAAQAQRLLHASATLLDEMVPAPVNALQQRLDARMAAHGEGA